MDKSSNEKFYIVEHGEKSDYGHYEDLEDDTQGIEYPLELKKTQAGSHENWPDFRTSGNDISL